MKVQTMLNKFVIFFYFVYNIVSYFLLCDFFNNKNECVPPTNQQMQEDPSTSTVRFNVQNEIGLSDTDKLQTTFEKRLQAPAVTIQRVQNSFT